MTVKEALLKITTGDIELEELVNIVMGTVVFILLILLLVGIVTLGVNELLIRLG